MKTINNKILFLIFIIPVFCFCTTKNTEQLEQPQKIPSVKIIHPVKAEFAKSIHTTGKLEASQQLKLSFTTSGIISKMNVKEGQKVKKGDLIAKLDNTEISSKRSQAVEQVGKAQRDLKRVENLYQDSVVTLELLQNARTAYEVASMQLKVADFNLSKSHIRAPENGVILKVLAEGQEIIAAGHPAIYFGATNSTFYANCQVTDKSINKIRLGDSVQLSSDAFQGKKLSGEVHSIGAMADPYSGTFSLQIAIQKTDIPLFSGLFTSVDIYTSELVSSFTIPMEAIIETADNKAKIAVITNGGYSILNVDIIELNNNSVHIQGNISENDQVITMGYNNLKAGQKFNIQQ